MTKTKLFIGFRNGKALAMVFTTALNCEDAVDCDYFIKAGEGTEKQQLNEWFKKTDGN